MNQEDINQQLIKRVTDLFKDRIICLLRYGPDQRLDGSPPSDLDYLLLLDSYQSNDYLLLSSLKQEKLPIEIFIDYKDQIISKGIKSYQRGRHGSYFFKILVSAKVLLGTNFYQQNEEQLDENRIRFDLLYRVEEYFYRIQKSALNGENPNKKEVEKYLGRILTDLFLVTGELKFSDMHQYHYTSVMSKLLKSTKLIDDHTKDLIDKLQYQENLDLNLLGEIVGNLYNKYLEISNS